MNKKQFISKLLRERDKFELLMNRAGFVRRMTIKGVEGSWSIKDVLAHIWAYEQYMSDRLDEIARGEVYIPSKTHHALEAFLDQFGYPDFGSPLLEEEDRPNTWVFEKYRNVALEEIVAQELQAFTSICSTLEKMSEDTIHNHNLYDRVADNTYRHYHDHLKRIRVWLRTNTASSRNN
jgi:hypothetical protein